MKLISIASTIAVANAQTILELVASEIESRMTYTPDGFIADFLPYAHVVVENDGMKGTIKSCPFGDGNEDIDNWEITSQGNKQTALFYGSGFGRNDALFAPNSRVSTYTYDESVNIITEMTGLQVIAAKDLDFVFNDGSSCGIDETHNLVTSMSKQKQKVMVSLDYTGSRNSNNCDSFAPPFPILKNLLVEPFDMSTDVTITVANAANCQAYLNKKMNKPCDVTFNHKSTLNGESLNQHLKVMLREFAVIAKMPGNLIFLRGENMNGNTARLSAGNYYGLYQSNAKGTWQKILKNRKSYTIIARVPGFNTINGPMANEFAAKLEPFQDLVAAANSSLYHIPYAIFYLDELLATFDDEFDCARMVELSRVESDLIAQQAGVKSINYAMKNACTKLNRVIVEDYFKCPELKENFEAMRLYVATMLDDKASFDRIYGSIF